MINIIVTIGMYLALFWAFFFTAVAIGLFIYFMNGNISRWKRRYEQYKMMKEIQETVQSSMYDEDKYNYLENEGDS